MIQLNAHVQLPENVLAQATEIIAAINEEGSPQWMALGAHLAEVLRDGFWNANDYQRGMANGLLLAANTLMNEAGVQMQVLRAPGQSEEKAPLVSGGVVAKANSDFLGHEMEVQSSDAKKE